jgi:thioredoxin-related protein
MRCTFILVFVLFAFENGYSQSMHFSNLSWQAALAKARQEKKLLFVEMYTTWCTYCRQMERDVFAAKEAGDYYNTQFINVRYNALAGDGLQIRKSYALLGFPTFLYLDPNGIVIQKTAGFQPVNQFISNADSAVTIWLKQKSTHNN